MQTLHRWISLILLAIGLGCVVYFRWYEYLSFSMLKQHHELLQAWTKQYYLLSVLAYMSVYTIAVALSVPGAVFITLAGGFLFGFLATFYVVISATLGATLLFLAVRTAVGNLIASKASPWVKKLEKGFQEDSLQYLLILRLIPLFPFWVVNIVPALLDVKLKDFVLATFIGIIPGAFVYVMIGRGLNEVFMTNQEPDLNIIFSPPILLPLIGLAILACLPIIYKRFKKKGS